ncbi:LysR family transcriptional regulator [Clostridium oceanicum]|uniref:LysR family transcriptional regulator n=1 Tax=Clostridium oceanicum TaxID=1543 RepID=A0ABP3UEQ0_9CLOT
MNLEYLQAFYTTVKFNSISKAAKHLHVTQPGLSMQLRNLEKDLKVKLLTRSNKGVELTEEGSVVFDYASTMLSIQGNIQRDLKNLKDNSPKLIIGSCKSVGEYALPCSVYTFKKTYTELDIQLEVNNSSEIIKKLRDHTINIGIIQYFDRLDDLELNTIVTDELVLVGNSKVLKNTITLDEFKKLPLILREKNSGTRHLIEDFLKNKDLDINDLNIIYDLNSPQAIKSSIISGKGYSLLPKLTIVQELKEKTLKTVSVENFSTFFNYYITYRKNYDLTEYEKMFIDFIISSKRGFC